MVCSVHGLTTSLVSLSVRACLPSMAAASEAIPLPNVTSALGLVGSVVRARIEPLKLVPFSTLASMTSLMARGRSARSELSKPRNRCNAVLLMSYTARMALGVSVRAVSEPAATRAVRSAVMPAPVLVSTNSSASPTGAELNRVIRNAAVLARTRPESPGPASTSPSSRSRTRRAGTCRSPRRSWPRIPFR